MRMRARELADAEERGAELACKEREARVRVARERVEWAPVTECAPLVDGNARVLHETQQRLHFSEHLLHVLCRQAERAIQGAEQGVVAREACEDEARAHRRRVHKQRECRQRPRSGVALAFVLQRLCRHRRHRCATAQRDRHCARVRGLPQRTCTLC